jgi:hypothetical protein
MGKKRRRQRRRGNRRYYQQVAPGALILSKADRTMVAWLIRCLHRIVDELYHLLMPDA